MSEWVKGTDEFRRQYLSRDGAWCVECRRVHDERITATKRLGGGFDYWLHIGPHMTGYLSADEAKAQADRIARERG